jgi:hypothetical protein
MARTRAFLIAIFFLLVFLVFSNLVTASTLLHGNWEELKVYDNYVIQNPSSNAYSIVGRVIPIKDNSPYIDENEAENFAYPRAYQVCINVHVGESSQTGTQVTLDVYTYREGFPEDEIGHAQLHYQVLPNGYIMLSPTEVGLFPFYVVGFENKERIEKRSKDIHPYFGYSVGEIGGNFVESFKVDNVTEEVILTYLQSEDTIHIDSSVLKILDGRVLFLEYKWRVPVVIDGILPAKPFPLTSENCDYYVIMPYEKILYMKIPGTQNYVDFLKSLPPTGYEEPTWELNIPPALIVVAVVIVALIIYVSISRLRAGRR